MNKFDDYASIYALRTSLIFHESTVKYWLVWNKSIILTFRWNRSFFDQFIGVYSAQPHAHTQYSLELLHFILMNWKERASNKDRLIADSPNGDCIFDAKILDILCKRCVFFQWKFTLWYKSNLITNHGRIDDVQLLLEIRRFCFGSGFLRSFFWIGTKTIIYMYLDSVFSVRACFVIE